MPEKKQPQGPTVVLWHIPISHYNEKARWALDYKRIPHERRTPMPGVHQISALRLTRGKHNRLPVLGIDRRRIGDSTAIIAALEELEPVPPLYPAAAESRRRALELEDYFDEELAPRVRRFVWHHTLPDTDATIKAVAPRGGGRARLMRAMAPVGRLTTRLDYGVSDSSTAEAVRGIRVAMDRVEEEMGSGGYLVDDAFTVADLAGAALFTPLIAPPERPYAPPVVAEPVLELRAELGERPCGRWVAEMYRRHRGVSAEIAA